MKLFEEVTNRLHKTNLLNVFHLEILQRLGYTKDQKVEFLEPEISPFKTVYRVMVAGKEQRFQIMSTKMMKEWLKNISFQRFILQEGLYPQFEKALRLFQKHTSPGYEFEWDPLIKQEFTAFFGAKRSGVI